MNEQSESPLAGQQPRLLVLDVDGVLTDNTLWIPEEGREMKAFHVPDGAGLRWLLEEGVEVAWISGRASEVTRKRAAELGIDEVHTGIRDKATCLQELLERLSISAADTVYIGDDLIDLPPMALVGTAVAVADAQPVVLEMAAHVTRNRGGHGAVREVCEWILKSLGAWSDRIHREMSGDSP